MMMYDFFCSLILGFGTCLLFIVGIWGWFSGSPRRFFKTGVTFNDEDQQKVSRICFLIGWFCVIIGSLAYSLNHYDVCASRTLCFVIIILNAYIITRIGMLVSILGHKIWKWVIDK